MSPQNDSKNDEVQLATDLDEFLTAQMNGKDIPIPPEFSGSDAEVAAMLTILVDSAKQLQPDPIFASELEARLLGSNVVEASKMFQDSEETPTVAIEDKLRSTQSRIPSPNLFKQASNMKLFFSPLSFFPSRPIRRFSLAAIVLLSVSSVVVASTPALRSFAQSIFENFIRTNSDMVGSRSTESTGKRRPLTEKQKQEIEELKKLEKQWENQELIASTVAEMEAKIGYDLKEPTFIPAGYISDDEIGSFSLDVVMLDYKNHQNNARILITQKRLDGEKIIGPILNTPPEKYKSKGQRIGLTLFPPQPNTLYGSKDPALQQVDKAPVGVSAKIESVQIGQSTGEYVEGAWDSIYSQDGSSTSGMEWNQNAPLRQLQWKEGNTLYHIASTNEIGRDELVAIANSMR